MFNLILWYQNPIAEGKLRESFQVARADITMVVIVVVVVVAVVVVEAGKVEVSG